MSITSHTGQARGMSDGKTFLRVGEAAEMLSVSRWTIYRWVEEGRLRGTKLGRGSLRIFRESALQLIERNEKAVSDPHSGSERS